MNEKNDGQKVLVFDNAINELEIISKIVENMGYEPLKCSKISNAISELNEHENSICKIIFDLNMPTRGFNEDQIKRSNSGRATGWVWYMDNIVNNAHLKERFIKNTLIYSGSEFLSELSRIIKSDEEKKLLSKVRQVTKGMPNSRNLIKDFLKN